MSCTGRRSIPAEPLPTPRAPSFAFVSALIIPTDHLPRAERMGGISGLAYDRDRAEWIAVSDDHLTPRWFVCRFSEHDDHLRLMSTARVIARLPALVDGLARVPDFEAVTILPGGDLLIASEGNRLSGRRFPASIMRFRRDGGYVADVPIPDRYLPSTEGRVDRGMRDNHGFESLALSPDGSRLWAIAEAPLLQDDDPASAGRGARSRLIEFVPTADSFRATRELVYPIDRVAIPRPLDASSEVVDQGVSDMTVLPGGTILAMERAFVRDRVGRRTANVIRLFRLDLEGAEDVSSIDSLRDAPNARAIRKTLVRDLVTIAPALPPRLTVLDNFEAMAPGPSLPPGPSLLLMSDDNFSASQVTAAILLR